MNSKFQPITENNLKFFDFSKNFTIRCAAFLWAGYEPPSHCIYPELNPKVEGDFKKATEIEISSSLPMGVLLKEQELKTAVENEEIKSPNLIFAPDINSEAFVQREVGYPLRKKDSREVVDMVHFLQEKDIMEHYIPWVYKRRCDILHSVLSGKGFPEFEETMPAELKDRVNKFGWGFMGIYGSEPQEEWEKRLKEAINKAGRIKKSAPEFSGRSHLWHIERVDLKAYAESINDVPLFLRTSKERISFTPDSGAFYLNKDHEYFSPELEAAVSVWIALFGEDGYRPNDKNASAPTAKEQIKKWLKENKKKLSNEALERLMTVCNPQKFKRK